jgi:hypothetical protein
MVAVMVSLPCRLVGPGADPMKLEFLIFRKAIVIAGQIAPPLAMP